MKRILCIRLGDWPIQRIRAARPELDRKPIVLEEIRRGSRRVAACSAEAEALGVAPGMPAAEAAALARSATLAREPYDPAADREALESLAASCGRFSPLVGLDDSPTPDSLLLDVTGLARFFGGEGPLAEQVLRHFAHRGLAVRVAVADTVGTAWAVSHFGQKKRLQIDHCKSTTAYWRDHTPAQSSICNSQFAICSSQFAICNSLSPPSPSVFIIPPGGAPTALRPLPVEALRLPDDVADLLHQLGIHRIGQLELLPRAELTSRFGPRL